MASMLRDSVVHWRKKLERTEDESVILNVVHKLSRVPVTVELLQDTGIGKVIRSLAKKSGKVGLKATAVLHNWRELVSSAQKSPDNSHKAAASKHSSSEKKERIETGKSHKHSVASHGNQNLKEKKSYISSGKQHPSTNVHSSENYNYVAINTDSGYSSYGFNSSFKNSNTDESDAESPSVANSSYAGKRKLLEVLPSNTENQVLKTKRLKKSSSFSPDSSHINGTEKQSSHISQKKKDKDKKSHGSEFQKDAKTSKNSHVQNGTPKNSEKSEKPQKNKTLKIKPAESFTSSEARFEDCLNFNDFVSVKKKKSSKTSTDKKDKHIESSDKMIMIERSKPKESAVVKTITKFAPSTSTITFTEQHKNSFPSLLSNSAKGSLPMIKQVDILSTLPQIQPNYRPLPQRNFDGIPNKKKVLTNEDAIKFTSSRKERTSVYSGKKSLLNREVPTLYNLCARLLYDNMDAIEYLGPVPYFVIKPVLQRCTAIQLYRIEDYNPHLIADSGELWEIHCLRDFRCGKLQENETWRELYLRLFDERERKLKSITAHISASMLKSGPARQVKLAYVDTVAKPPRDVARKQAKMGTGIPVNHTVKAGPLSKASPRPTAPAKNSAAAAKPKPQNSIPKKPKTAPLMAKILKSIKQCYRR